MSEVLTSAQRRALDTAVQRARTVAESAADDELRRLAVAQTARPGYLTDEENALRLALREKARQLGDSTQADGADLPLLRADIAYEQWHRLLFARFLAANGLLLHPTYGVPVTLEQCDSLAAENGEPDGWSVAATFASTILPGVFRLTDPSVRVRFSPERRAELEAVVAGIGPEVFTTEDALGWVYQFWQTAEKKRVNESGRKIGGADLSPVTQLFTENYMVRFLLENSLGAWWAARHPDSPLVAGWEYLRRLDDGTPAAGTFDEWPTTAAEVTVMDPCCGSGHFLVAAFGMLWRMRAEEEGLAPADAQDAVLRDNLFGLELDPRCTQIATFNVVLEAWKQGGYRALPTPQVACSGVPVRQTRDEWLVGVPLELQNAMGALHQQFCGADRLGSLIDPRPRRSTDDVLFGRDLGIAVSWAELRPHLESRHARAGARGPVLDLAAEDVVHAAALLGRRCTLVATNPPWLGTQRMNETTANFLLERYPDAAAELATAFASRFLPGRGTSLAAVMPLNWLFLRSFRNLRRRILSESTLQVLAPLGDGAFPAISGQVVQSALVVFSLPGPPRSLVVDARGAASAVEKARALANGEIDQVDHENLRRHPDSLLDARHAGLARLGAFASSWQGLVTTDSGQFVMNFWEVSARPEVWARYVVAPSVVDHHSGREFLLRWESGRGALSRSKAHNFNPRSVLGKCGVIVAQSSMRATLYAGEMFNHAACPIIPHDQGDLPALWAFLSSAEYVESVRRVNSKVMVDSGYLIEVPFDRDRWQRVADEADPLPEPHSDDPTQWLFTGTIPNATEPLQVAVARLLGYRWPDQLPDDLDELADTDGIVALPALLGEQEAATRLRAVLARAYGDAWSSDLERRLAVEAGGTTGVLADWLRDTFFAHHCKVFGQRPFLWHVWDGRKDGFSAIVNYHRLDTATLTKLTFTTLGGWIERQRADADAGKPGADTRLAAAQDLQRNLRLILDGAPPYDVYIRWKSTAEQPIGWDPDLDDGVRLNIRPFVTAGVLRAKVNVHWKKDRGTNPDGTERHNDRHPTLEERRAAGAAQATGR